MKLAFIMASALLVSACATQSTMEQPTQVARGQALVAEHCSSCHATGRTGDSPAPEAPPFRTLSQNYRVDALEEAFAEGISVGHPAMPQFAFAPDDVSALVAYLQSIQDASPPSE